MPLSSERCNLSTPVNLNFNRHFNRQKPTIFLQCVSHKDSGDYKRRLSSSLNSFTVACLIDVDLILFGASREAQPQSKLATHTGMLHACWWQIRSFLRGVRLGISEMFSVFQEQLSCPYPKLSHLLFRRKLDRIGRENTSRGTCLFRCAGHCCCFVIAYIC